MPEGPSLVILKEELQPFKGRKIIEQMVIPKIDKSVFINKKVTDFKTWGKHFLICLPRHTVRIHFLLFGKYLINQTKDANPVLHLQFSNGDVYFYTSAVTLLADHPTYLRLERRRNERLLGSKKARKKYKVSRYDGLRCHPQSNIFSGAGNIIKNEVLYRIRVHPESKIGKLPPRKLTQLINEVRNYSFDFLKLEKSI